MQDFLEGVKREQVNAQAVATHVDTGNFALAEGTTIKVNLKKKKKEKRQERKEEEKRSGRGRCRIFHQPFGTATVGWWSQQKTARREWWCGSGDSKFRPRGRRQQQVA